MYSDFRVFKKILHFLIFDYFNNFYSIFYIFTELVIISIHKVPMCIRRKSFRVWRFLVKNLV